jgi:hypothetical protein
LSFRREQKNKPTKDQEANVKNAESNSTSELASNMTTLLSAPWAATISFQIAFASAALVIVQRQLAALPSLPRRNATGERLVASARVLDLQEARIRLSNEKSTAR